MSDPEKNLANLVGAGMVPSGYAEKAMASLLQLHAELMEEKERRVDLYRRMMEKDQSIAELRMYVRLLEEKLGLAPPSVPAAPGESEAAPIAGGPPPTVVSKVPPRPPKVEARPVQATTRSEGWKSW